MLLQESHIILFVWTIKASTDKFYQQFFYVLDDSIVSQMKGNENRN